MASSLRHADYTIAWIAILPIEVEAALGALNRRHSSHFESVCGDEYTYIGGEINGHNMVIAKLPTSQNYGVGAAAALISQVKARFENIWFALLVGVAAELPNLWATDPDRRRDIRLGDVLVCVPDSNSTGIIHYDLGRETEVGFERNGRQSEPPALVCSAISDIHLVDRPFRTGNDPAVLLEGLYKSVGYKFKYLGQDHDILLKRQVDSESFPSPDEPVIEDDFFIGRHAELKEIENILQPQDVSSRHRRLVLGGIGGIGKTQLAIMYVKRHYPLYSSVFWLNAASEIVLKNSFRRMARRILGVEQCQAVDEDDQLLHHVTRWLLTTGKSEWLLIFDNYDDPDTYDIGKYCPYGTCGSAIITTRLSDKVRKDERCYYNRSQTSSRVLAS